MLDGFVGLRAELAEEDGGLVVRLVALAAGALGQALYGGVVHDGEQGVEAVPVGDDKGHGSGDATGSGWAADLAPLKEGAGVA